MDTKKKADDLYNKFYDLLFTSDFREVESKRAAILCVDEIIESQKCCDECAEEGSVEIAKWDKVKEHLNNM